jgi:hypothetical protein
MRCTIEERSEVRVGHVTSGDEERGASGVGGARDSEERASEWRRIGARWENTAAASRVRRGVQMRIKYMK